MLAGILPALALASCSSDPQGPVSSVFMEEDIYTPDSGETVRFAAPVDEVTVVPVPVGIGQSSLLRLGETKGIRFEAILLSFDFDSIPGLEGRTVDTFTIDLPVNNVTSDFELGVSFFELDAPFSEDDTITTVPAHQAAPIEGPAGATVRVISIEDIDFALDKSIAQDWIDGAAEPWGNGIVIRWAAEPETAGLIEMRSQNFGSDPPALRLVFSDGSEAVLPCVADYNVTDYGIEGVDCVGGVATRVHFEFDLSGVREDAMVHYSALVLHVDGDRGLSATDGELALNFTTDFIYYLYTPDSGDVVDQGFLSGTGVATDSFVPTVSSELRITLGGFTRDVLEDLRVNTGLVIQSDLENVRFQKAVFFGTAAADSLRPYIEIFYTLPAVFDGG